ncbi:MAG: hypothetical protein AAF721_00220 [Myxococcota bacterium]
MARQTIIITSAVLLGSIGGGALLHATTAIAANADASVEASAVARPVPVANLVPPTTHIVMCRGPLAVTADSRGPWLTASRAPKAAGKDGVDLKPGECALPDRALHPSEPATIRLHEMNNDGPDSKPKWKVNSQPRLRNILPFLAQCTSDERCVMSVKVRSMKFGAKDTWFAEAWKLADIRFQYPPPKKKKVVKAKKKTKTVPTPTKTTTKKNAKKNRGGKGGKTTIPRTAASRAHERRAGSRLPIAP